MIQIFKELYYILDKKQRIKSFGIICLQIIGSMLELLGVTVIVPFISAIINPIDLMNNEIMIYFFQIFHADEEWNVILLVGILLITVYLLKNLFLLSIAHITCKFSTNTQKDICLALMKSYMSREYIFFTKVNSMELVRGVTSDANSVMAAISGGFKLFADALTICVIMIYLFFTDFMFAMVMCALVLLCIFIFTFVFKRKIICAGNLHVKYNGESLKCANQAFNGIKEITVKNKNKFFIKKYEMVRSELANAVYKHDFLEKVPTYLFEIICVSGLIGIIYVKMFLGENMNEFIPMLAVFAVSAFRILPLTSKISAGVNSLFYYKEALDITCDNIKEMRNSEKRTENLDGNAIDNFGFEKEIALKNIYWKYPENNSYILEDVNLKIEKGESIALVGPSGAGKTTLSDIILGLLKPQKGDVLVDGKSIYSNMKSWSAIIQYVPQTVYLIDDTIRRNVAFALEDKYIDDDRVWGALKSAQLETYIKALPDGLDTIVGERGIRLSGGQRQRIAIARALYDEPEIIVFDEATSALDTETESAIMEAINRLKGIKTLIIVAHRLTTIQSCDHIYEVNKRKIEEIHHDVSD